MIPKKVKVKEKKYLDVMWEDDTETVIPLKYLRDECPCATCKGETILLKTYRPPARKIITPEMYEIRNIEVVGEYAIQITWSDGHNTGIYSWEFLRELEKGLSSDGSENKKQDYTPLA